jgi:hypothetical protein
MKSHTSAILPYEKREPKCLQNEMGKHSIAAIGSSEASFVAAVSCTSTENNSIFE